MHRLIAWVAAVVFGVVVLAAAPAGSARANGAGRASSGKTTTKHKKKKHGKATHHAAKSHGKSAGAGAGSDINPIPDPCFHDAGKCQSGCMATHQTCTNKCGQDQGCWQKCVDDFNTCNDACTKPCSPHTTQ